MRACGFLKLKVTLNPNPLRGYDLAKTESFPIKELWTPGSSI